MKVAVYRTPTSIQIAEAFAKGAEQCGDKAIIYDEYKGLTGEDVVAFYGMSPEHTQCVKDMTAIGRPSVIADLGYFGRSKTQSAAYYKISVNDNHPTAFFQNIKHSSDRFNIFGIKVEPMRKRGNYILFAGIGPKSSVLYNIEHQSWDQWAISELNKYTKIPIYYRAKPNHAEKFKQIAGSIWSDPTRPLESLLNDAWAVVTRHSNVAVDGIIRGVPCFAIDGVATKIGLTDLSQINTPRYPSYKEQLQFCYDLAYTQWTLSEVSEGKLWKHLKSEKLLRIP
jgi:hypothetical protein